MANIDAELIKTILLTYRHYPLEAEAVKNFQETIFPKIDQYRMRSVNAEDSETDIDKVIFQDWKKVLDLRIPRPAVVFQNLRLIASMDECIVEGNSTKAWVTIPAPQFSEDRLYDFYFFLSVFSGHERQPVTGIFVGAHSSSVGSSVAVKGSLVVPCFWQGH